MLDQWDTALLVYERNLSKMYVVVVAVVWQWCGSGSVESFAVLQCCCSVAVLQCCKFVFLQVCVGTLFVFGGMVEARA